MAAALLVAAGLTGLHGCAGDTSDRPHTAAPDAGSPGTSNADAGAVRDDAERRPAAADTFVTEALGVGSSWYEYDGVTHAVTPAPERYVVAFDDGTGAAVEVVTYYNRDGDSGWFTLDVWRHDGAAWGERQTWSAPSNVKDGLVCVSLEEPTDVPCDAGPDMVLRTDRRVTPGAGFAVAEPGMYFDVARVVRVDATSDLPDLAELATLDAEPCALRDTEAAVLGDPRPEPDAPGPGVVMHATLDQRLALWRASSTDDPATLELQVTCTELAMSPAAQPGFSEPPRTLSLVPGDDAWVLVRLCPADGGGPAMTTWASPGPGLWPADATFDLMVGRADDGVRWLAAPGTPVHLVALPEDGGSDTLGDPGVPEALWE